MEELEDWPKLKELCALLESGESSKVRRLLRAHEETGFSEEDREETRFRIALDAELERITHDEFRAQCGEDRQGGGQEEAVVGRQEKADGLPEADEDGPGEGGE